MDDLIASLTYCLVVSEDQIAYAENVEYQPKE